MRRFIEDFGLIGDLHTAALVSLEGGIEWLCVPRFDSDGPFMSYGNVEMETRIVCRFAYGTLSPWTRRLRGNVIAMTIGSDALTLHASPRAEVDAGDAHARFAVGRNERATFLLQWHPSHEPPPRAQNPLALPASS